MQLPSRHVDQSGPSFEQTSQHRRNARICSTIAAVLAAVAVALILVSHADAGSPPKRGFPSPSAGVSSQPWGLFGTREIKRDSIHLLRKWADLLKRLKRDQRRPACARCASSRWHRYVKSLRRLSPMAQLHAVNRAVNSWRYIEDRANYGVVDYWATPAETMRRGGDCEDFAVAKYVALRQLGWSDKQLRVVVVIDRNLRTAHAVLAVAVNGTQMILDNQSRQVLDHRRIRHYRPVYSINHANWWFHKRVKRTRYVR